MLPPESIGCVAQPNLENGFFLVESGSAALLFLAQIARMPRLAEEAG
jgi:hypothetical protein